VVFLSGASAGEIFAKEPSNVRYIAFVHSVYGWHWYWSVLFRWTFLDRPKDPRMAKTGHLGHGELFHTHSYHCFCFLSYHGRPMAEAFGESSRFRHDTDDTGPAPETR